MTARLLAEIGGGGARSGIKEAVTCSPKSALALIFSLVGTALGFAVLAGCHSQPPLTEQQAEGKHVYEVGCAHCHRDNDLNLKKVPPDLHNLFRHKTLPGGEPATDAEVEHVVLTGKGMMPSFAYQITQEQLNALIAYLHTGLR